MIKIKTDRAPTPIKYKLEVTCTLPGMIYYYNTMEKDYSEVTDLAEMKKRLSSPYSTLFEQAGYQILDTADVYQTIEFDTWANQNHIFQVWCEDIMETSDYRKIQHTS